MKLINSIEKFLFFIGGYMSTNYNIEYNKNKVGYSTYYLLKLDERTIKKVSPEHLNNFKNGLIKLKITDWKVEYINQVMDGTHWTLKIEYNHGQKKNIYGSNHYPGNKPGNIKASKQFNAFLSHIETLIDEPGFFKKSQLE